MGLILSPVLSLVVGVGCGLVVNGEEIGDEPDSIADDLAQYEELAATLEAGREQALPETATAVRTTGPWLTWLEGQTLNLRRYPDGLELALALEIVDGNYAVSESHASTATVLADEVRYTSFALATDPLAPSELVDEQTFARPKVGAWSPYVLLGDSLVVVEDQQIWRWRVGVEEPIAIGTLAAAGMNLSRVEQLDAVVAEDDLERLIVVADGWLWVVELASFTAVAVAELDVLLAVDPHGLLFTRADGLYLVELAQLEDPEPPEIIRIDTAIAASGWALNPTFASIHEYTGDGATLADERVYTITSAGLFAYDLASEGPDAITPILIEPRWDVDAQIPRIEYREPMLTADGTVFVRGLIGPSGEIGDTGPVYSLPVEP